MDTRCKSEIWWTENRNVRLFERKNDKNWHNRYAINNVTTNVDNKCWLQFWQCLQLYLSCGTVVRAIWKQYGCLNIKKHYPHTDPLSDMDPRDACAFQKHFLLPPVLPRSPFENSGKYQKHKSSPCFSGNIYLYNIEEWGGISLSAILLLYGNLHTLSKNKNIHVIYFRMIHEN